MKKILKKRTNVKREAGSEWASQDEPKEIPP